MKYVKFTVTYELDEETVDRLNELTERWKKTHRKITAEELFDFAMTTVGNIQGNLDVIDRFLKRQEAQK